MSFSTTLKRLTTAVAVLGLPLAAQAQAVFTTTYGFGSVVGGPPGSGLTDPTPVPTSAGVTYGGFTAVGQSVAGPNASSRFSFTGQQTGATSGSNTFTGAILTTRYYEVTLTPKSGNTLSLTGITFTAQRSATGVRQWAVRSSADSYAANLTASVVGNTNLTVATTPANTFQVVDRATANAQAGSTVTLSGASFTNQSGPITFRFYGFNAEATGGSFSIDDVAFSGSYTNANAANTALTIANGTFPSTVTGSSSTQNFTLSNSSGTPQTATLSLGTTGTAASPFSLTPTTVTVPANGSVTTAVTFAPTVVGTFTNNLVASVTGFQPVSGAQFSAVAVAPATFPNIAVTQGAASFPDAGATPYSFGSVASGNNVPVTFTITNSSTTDALTISSITAGGDYAVSGVPTTAAANGGTATVTVTFTPTTNGTRTATLTINSNAASPNNVYTVLLTGTGTGFVVTFPNIAVTQGATSYPDAGTTAYDFGSVASGSNAPVTFTITNSSTTNALTISSIAATGDYAVSGVPTTAAANGGTATVTVTFTPTSSGTRTGTLTINSNAASPNDVYTVLLTGTGTGFTPTITSYSTTTIFAGQTTNLAITGTNLTGATASATGSTAGTVGVGAVNYPFSSATNADVLLTPATTGSFTLNFTIGGSTFTQAITVVAPPVVSFFEPFEAASKASYTPTVSVVALKTGSWTFTDALLGNSASDRRSNSQAVRTRTVGAAEMNFDKPNGASTVSFQAATFGSDAAGSTLTVALSTNGGGAYTTIGTITPTSTLTTYTLTPNQVGPIRLRITSSAAGTTQRLNIDDLTVSDFPVVANLVVNTPGQTISGAYNNVTIENGGTATLGSTLTVNGTLVVQSGGTLNLNCQTIAGPGTVNVNAGATLGICDGAGLPVATGRTYSPNATYVYNGTVAQSSGAGLPATVQNLTVNNTNGLTLSQTTAVAQALTLTSGSLATGNLLTLLSNATGTALVVNAGSGTVTGSTAVQRFINPSLNAGIGYRHFSSPVAAQPFSGLAAGTFTPNLNTAYNASPDPYNTPSFPNVFEYDESRVNTVVNVIPDAFSKGWKVPTTANLAVGKGYDVNISAANKVTFNGTLNNGTLPVALTRTGGTNGGWQLVGNPYAAPLNIAAIAAGDRTNLDAAFYVFRSTNQYDGFYDSYVNNIGSLVAASGQGFFCRVSAGQSAGTLTFRNTQRQTSFSVGGSLFQRGAADARPQLRLTLASAANPAAADQAYVYLQAGATVGFDTEFDAAKMANPTGLNLAALAGTAPVAINGLPLLTAATLVPLTVGLPAAGTYVLTAADFANFGSTAVALRDALTGTRTALTAGTAYRFTAAGTTANGRFTLELNPAAAPLATAAQALAALVQVYPNPAHGTFHLTLPASAKAATVQIVNALGQVVITRSLTSAEADFSTANLAAGVYTLRLAVNGTAVARKLVVE